MGEVTGAAGEEASTQGGTGGGEEAQAVEGLQRAWADVSRRAERVERARSDDEWQGERAQGSEKTESGVHGHSGGVLQHSAPTQRGCVEAIGAPVRRVRRRLSAHQKVHHCQREELYGVGDPR